MKKILVLILLVAITSCIPVKVAPKFKKEDYKVISAKKFQRKLSRDISFIFLDPKDANHFYTYLNTKFQLNHNNVDSNIPIKIEEETFYLSYSEATIEDKAVNLPLVLIDAKRQSNGNDAIFENNHVLREGFWYIVLTVYDKNIKNCLLDEHPKKTKTIQYLKNLKDEYIRTQNYEELLFTKKS